MRNVQVLSCAVSGAEPQDQLAEGALLQSLLLTLKGFVVVGVGVTYFKVFIKFDGSFLNPN